MKSPLSKTMIDRINSTGMFNLPLDCSYVTFLTLLANTFKLYIIIAIMKDNRKFYFDINRTGDSFHNPVNITDKEYDGVHETYDAAIEYLIQNNFYKDIL